MFQSFGFFFSHFFRLIYVTANTVSHLTSAGKALRASLGISHIKGCDPTSPSRRPRPRGVPRGANAERDHGSRMQVSQWEDTRGEKAGNEVFPSKRNREQGLERWLGG